MSQDARRDEESVTQARSHVIGFDYVDTSKTQKHLYGNVLSVPELYSLKVIPIFADEHHIHFGITTTTSQQTVKTLQKRFSDQKTTFSLISEAGFREYMQLYDPPKKVEYQDITLDRGSSFQQAQIVETVSATLEHVRPDDILAYLVKQAYMLKASDIHLECQRQNVRVRFRVDGVLHPVAEIAYEKYHHLISVVASAGNIQTESNDPQSGHISRSYQMATGENVVLNLRIETIPTVYGMDIVMRLFNLKLEFFNLENLGLSVSELKVVEDIINHPFGMVLVVGPTGSGKTTTLYSLINTLNSPERKIITLEDPVEYNMPGVVQIPVSGQIEGKSFASKLRSVLRLDPDVVMVGEIRDQDTARTSLQGALTGHLVLSSFHAANAAAALTRLLDLVGINPLFSSAMRLVMAQRLVRRLDEATRQPYKPDDNLKRQLGMVLDSLPPNVKKPDLDQISLYKPGKSEENPFGYRGQLAVREQLIMTPGVQALLKLTPNQLTTEMLQQKAVEEGMVTMLQDGILKAIAGLTTIEEIYRVVD